MMGKANIFKMGMQGVILMILLLISSLMLNVGLMLALNFQGFLGNMTTELNTSDVFYTFPQARFTEDIRNRIESHEQILSLDVYNSIVVSAEIAGFRDSNATTIFFRNKEITQAVSHWTLVSETIHDVQNPVFVPYGFSTSGGFSLGDQMSLVINDSTLIFTVAGFIEDILFSSAADVQFAFYVDGPMYAELLQTFEQYHTALLFADISGESQNVELFIREIFDEVADSSVTFISRTYEMLVGGRALLPSILSIMVIVFAFIIVVVCLTMIRFRIGNSIEEDMPAMGSLKATGYTSWQIRAGLLVQYLMMAFFGAILGIPLSYIVQPFIRGVIAIQTGLFWQQGLDIPLNLLSIGIIISIVAVLVVVCSRKIKNVDPVVAIRGGAAGRNFKHNYLPLDKTSLSLNMTLGSKAMLQNIGQSVALFIVFVVIAFTGSFFVGMRHMATAQSDAYMALTGVELSDVIVDLHPSADSNNVRDTIAAMDGVTQALFIDSSHVMTNGEMIIAYVMDDFSHKVNPSVYRGRYPIHPNEIAISGIASDMLNIGIDDIWHLGEQNMTFIVTGITQGQGTTGINGPVPSISITTAGIRNISPDFRQMRLGVYLDMGMDVSVFITDVSVIVDGQILSMMNWRDMLEDGNVMITGILVLLSTAMLGFAVIVILLVLYFIVGAVIIRRYRYLGIQKAMGYTTFELMHQVSVSFILPLVGGIISGAVLMMFIFNHIVALVMTPLGVRQSSFDVPHLWVALSGIVLTSISYTTILIITSRIRKISAYDLVR